MVFESSLLYPIFLSTCLSYISHQNPERYSSRYTYIFVLYGAGVCHCFHLCLRWGLKVEYLPNLPNGLSQSVYHHTNKYPHSFGVRKRNFEAPLARCGRCEISIYLSTYLPIYLYMSLLDLGETYLTTDIFYGHYYTWNLSQAMYGSGHGNGNTANTPALGET